MPVNTFPLHLSPDGRYLAVGIPNEEHTALTSQVWEISTGRQMPVRKTEMSDIAFSMDSQSVIIQNVKGLTFWNIQKGTAEQYYQGYFGENLTLNSDGTILAGTGSFSDPSMYLFNAVTGHAVKTLSGHRSNQITSLKFSPDGTFIVSSGDDGTIRIWGVQTDF